MISHDRGNDNLQEIKGEERQEILKRLGPSFPHLSDSLGLVRQCSLTFQKHKPSFINTDEFQTKPMKREVQSMTDLTKKYNVDPRIIMFDKVKNQYGTIELEHDRATYDVVDSRGAILKQPQSSVELHIPSKAVPKTQTSPSSI